MMPAPVISAVEAFVEKPDAATAANYVAESYLWNRVVQNVATTRPYDRNLL
jgi:mannose-1-phosphate guanylyltransferase